ncbi:MAG: M36 family metallopeptidase [Verrucomicrobia bacterium]|nr:M36 family metallopeptidase [Verrucomicrobiota bacterium]
MKHRDSISVTLVIVSIALVAALAIRNVSKPGVPSDAGTGTAGHVRMERRGPGQTNRNARLSLHGQHAVRHARATNMSGRVQQSHTVLLARKDGGFGYLTEPSPQDPQAIAVGVLTEPGSLLTPWAIPPDEIVLKSRYRSSHNGLTHLHFRQHLDGIELARGDIHLNIDAEGRVLNLASRAIPALRARAPLPAAGLSALQAAERLAVALRLELREPLSVLSSSPGAARQTLLSDGGIFRRPVPAKLEYMLDHDAVVHLVWNLQAEPPGGHHYWNAHIDAVDGALRAKENWVVSESYTVYPGPLIDPFDGPAAAVAEPYLESPSAASPFGWHETNGVGGAEFTITRGNNAHAYEDSSDLNASTGNEPDGGDNLVFDFTADTNQAPQTYSDASVVNLFYWNNLLHDIHYEYGFDEPAGNFQANNYGAGGAAGDPVRAEAQDAGGFNNANMLTLPDGESPRMQMFLGNNTTPFRDGSLDNLVVIHEYGHGVSTRLTGGPAAAGCLTATQSGGMGEGWSDWWGLVLTAKPGDTAGLARPVGNWLFGEAPSGNGIRSHPYTTNMTLNPLTYEDIATATQPHGIGTVWCSMLWDVYWILVDQFGFDSDFYKGTGGNHIAMQLIMDGLKLQPCNPTFVEARDAVLLADEVTYGGAHLDLLWAAFARRGLGDGADDGGDADSVVVSDGFGVPLLPFRVVGSLPASAEFVAAGPTSVVVTLSDPVDAASLGPADLVLAGAVSSGVVLTASNQATFSFVSSPVTNQGRHEAVMASNAVMRLSDGAPLQEWVGAFRFDETVLGVTNTVPGTNTIISLPITNIRLVFNEAVASSSVVAAALLPSIGIATGAMVMASNEVAYSLSQVDREGPMWIHLPQDTITDIHGNAGVAFIGRWELDFGIVPYPRVFATLGGALAAQDSELRGSIGTSNDIDVLLVALASNQLISVSLQPSSNLVAALELLDPGQSSVATTAVAAAGTALVLQGIRALATGDYALRISSHGDTQGGYDLRILRDAVFEDETFVGVSNDTLITAQNLDNVFTAGATSEAVVVGFAGFPGFDPTTSIFAEDFESGPGGFVIDNGFGSGNGMWHHTGGRSQDGLPGHSVTGAMYFGQNEDTSGNGDYNSGISVAGAVSTPPLIVPLLDSVSISFNTLLETEIFAEWDRAIVDVSSGGTPVSVLDNFGGGLPRDTDGKWASHTVDLTDFAGETVVVRFTFDTIDDILNDFEGWYVDDIAIEGASLTASERDLYRFMIPSNQTASVVVEGHDAGPLRLDLLDTNDQPIATGVKISPSVRAIENIAGSGVFFAAVAGGDIEYCLRVTLAPPASNPPPFLVLGSVPDSGTELAGAPLAVSLDFSEAVRLSSVQSNDLTINGVSATAVAVGDGDTLSFDLPALAEGTQTVAVSTGALTSVSGQLVEAFTAQFILDETPPRVASNSIAYGAVVDGYSFIVTTRFSEVMSAGHAGFDDFALMQVGSSNILFPNNFDWKAGNTEFTTHYTLIPDGEFELTLFSGDLKFEDRVGHDLDGERLAVPLPGVWSGDGHAGGDFRLRFFADQVTSELPTPFTARPPPGSRVYESQATAFVMPAGDLDEWVFEADADQSVSIVIEGGSNLQARARLLGPASNIIADATAACTGCPVIVQGMTLPDGGTHRVIVEGVSASTGAYTVRVVFNAIYELEPLLAVSNNTAVAAQSVESALLPLAYTLGDAGSILGALGSGDGEDWYGLAIASNQSLSLVLSATGTVSLQLYDVTGTTLLAGGVAGSNAALVVSGFVSSVETDLRVRVSGTSEFYTLVMARGAAFDVEPNNVPASAQDLVLVHATFGQLGPGSNDVDIFTFIASDGDEIVLETTTPGGGPVETRNLLDPLLVLHAPDGQLVAQDDNTAADKKNALLAHVAITTGVYRVHVTGVSGSTGDYVLRLNAPPPVHLAVVNLYGDASPPEGRHNVAVGATHNLSVTNTPVFLAGGTGLVACVGWVGSGDVPGTGLGTETGSLLFSNDSTIAWQWQPVQPGYFQDFDDWNMPNSDTASTNQQWRIHDGHVWSFFGRHSASNAAWLYNAQGFLPDSHITSPVFSNGFHALIFRVRNRNLVQLPLDILLSTTGAAWQGEASIISSSQTVWVEKVLTVDIGLSTQIRFDKPHGGIANTQIGLDDILVVKPFTPVSPDRDGDDLPDAWEILHALNHLDDGSGDPLNGSTGDGDGDGADNAHELDAGTDPNDRLSVFAVNAIAVPLAGGGVELSAFTQPARVYAIEYTDDALDSLPAWHRFTNLSNGVGTWIETNAAPAVYTFHDDFTSSTSGSSPAAGRRCYRIRVE